MIELVGKIGSMALIDPANRDLDYNKFSSIAKNLKPGMIWVSSGAVEIGRLDYIRRNGKELEGDSDLVKTDYASQGQAVLMQTYRNFISPNFSVRQILVEHNHFNQDQKREHIKGLLLRAAKQNAIPIVNYNDAVSGEETRKTEIEILRQTCGTAYELVDNDETASQIACLVEAKKLLILSTLEGIYTDISDPKSLIREISGKTANEVFKKLDALKSQCHGASRAGANGAKAKLEYIKPCVASGTRVIIASAKYNIADILAGNTPATVIYKKDTL